MPNVVKWIVRLLALVLVGFITVVGGMKIFDTFFTSREHLTKVWAKRNNR